MILADGWVSGSGALNVVSSTASLKCEIAAHGLPVTATSFLVSGNAILELQPGANLISTGGGSVGSGGQIINNGSITTPYSFVVNSGGTLSGTGTLTAPVVINQGTISPGNSPGTLTIDGDFHNAGTLVMEIGGTDPSQYDRLIVNGDLTSGGTIQFVLSDGFVPQTGDTFQFLTWTGALNPGSFAFDTTQVPEAVQFTPQWSSQGLSFVAAVPEPGLLAVAASLSGAMLLPRPRLRR